MKLAMIEASFVFRPVAILLPTGIYAPIHDKQGSIVALIDVETKEGCRIDCAIVSLVRRQEVGFSPWRSIAVNIGMKRLSSISLASAFYDPKRGRFVNKDPLGITLPNPYHFCKNNPLIYRDSNRPLYCRPYVGFPLLLDS